MSFDLLVSRLNPLVGAHTRRFQPLTSSLSPTCDFSARNLPAACCAATACTSAFDEPLKVSSRLGQDKLQETLLHFITEWQTGILTEAAELQPCLPEWRQRGECLYETFVFFSPLGFSLLWVGLSSVCIITAEEISPSCVGSLVEHVWH